MDAKQARKLRMQKLKEKRAKQNANTVNANTVSKYGTRVGTQSLNASEANYWNKKGVTFKPILEFNPLTDEEEKRLHDMYYVKNNRVGFLKLYESVRKPNGRTEKGKPIYSPTRAQVQAWLSKQIPALDYKPVESSKESRPILVSKIGDLVQMDYLDMGDNRDGKHRYMLNMVDVLSKKAYSRSPVNNTGTGPTAKQTLQLASEIFEEFKKDYNQYPKRLQTDNGPHFLKEFDAAFQDGGQYHDKIQYSSGVRYRATSQSVVERFNRTLRNMIRRYRNDTDTGGNDWFKHLQQFVSNYNSNKHSSLKLAPNEATNDNVQEYKDNMKEKALLKNKNLQRLQKGDKVRLKNFKKAKGESQYKDQPNWWPEIYEVYHVFQSKTGRAPEYALEPNPPTTLVNRPGYQGIMKTPRRKFTIYELQLLTSVGDKDYNKYKISTRFHEESDEEDDEPKPTAPVSMEPPDIVNKTIDVKFYNVSNKSYVVDKDSIKRRKKSSGTFYEGEVSSYNKETMEHKVKFDDGVEDNYNFTDKNKGDYIAQKTGWRLAKKMGTTPK